MSKVTLFLVLSLVVAATASKFFFVTLGILGLSYSNEFCFTFDAQAELYFKIMEVAAT
jgi:hypothetical protein